MDDNEKYLEFEKYTVGLKAQYPKNIIAFTTMAGSHVYNMNTPESDIDFRGVYVGSVEKYIGLNFDQKNFASVSDEKDSQIFELRNFLNLALKANPNALELLFVKYYERIIENDNFVPLFENADRWFLSKRLKNTYLGYATSQYNKITGVTTGKLGEARKHLVEKYGYDIKYASHAMRLLMTLKAYLVNGTFKTSPPDYAFPYLMNLKSGKFSVDEFMIQYANTLTETEFAFDRYGHRIPDEPNVDAVEEFLIQIIRKRINGKL